MTPPEACFDTAKFCTSICSYSSLQAVTPNQAVLLLRCFSRVVRIYGCSPQPTIRFGLATRLPWSTNLSCLPRGAKSSDVIRSYNIYPEFCSLSFEFLGTSLFQSFLVLGVAHGDIAFTRSNRYGYPRNICYH